MKTCHFLALALLITTTACTPKNESGSLKITMPTSVQATGTKSAVPAVSQSSNVTVLSGDDDEAWNTTLNPATGPELNCFAVFVGGGGLVGRSCSVNHAGVISRFSFGEKHFVGLVPSGGAVTIDEVPAGARVITVVGFKTATATNCAVNKLPDVQKAILSEPFVIASHAQNISPGQNEAFIRPTLDLTKKLVSCDFNGNNGGQKNLPMFGDRRDGRLTLGGVTGYTVTTGTSTYTQTDMTHVGTSGGPTGSKIFGAQRQVTNIDNATGTVITLGSAFTQNEFHIGDEVMWYVSAGTAPAAPDNEDTGACGSKLFRGAYGSRKIVSVNGQTVTLDQAIVENPQKILNPNLTASANSVTFCRVSLTRVPNFDELTVPASASWTIAPPNYDVTTGLGGIVALRTVKLNVYGSLTLSATDTGFAGGPSPHYAGASITGPGLPSALNGNASGGGTNASSGGAGGAGGGEGGSAVASGSPFGGQPINYCMDPRHKSIGSGRFTTCATKENGDLRCWGRSASGATGESYASGIRTVPSQTYTSDKFGQVTSGAEFSCGIRQNDKRVLCWGNNTNGQLGDGTLTDRFMPTLISDASEFAQISSGFSSTCGITVTGALMCWGYNNSYQLGDGTQTTRSVPILIDSGTTYKSVSVGKEFACGVKTNGDLRCWGANSLNQLGDGTTTTRTIPTSNGGTGYNSVEAGWYHACGIKGDRSMHCWGQNTQGQLGDNSTTQKSTPTQVAGTYLQVSAGHLFTCAINTTNDAYCWGYNNSGQLGDGTFSQRLIPTPLQPGTKYEVIATGENHACGITNEGTLRCWGMNTDGQLGIGGTFGANTPQTSRTQNICHAFHDRKMFVGGGGGGGGGVVGGRGGGLVLIFAKETSGTGGLYVQANGNAGGSDSFSSGGGGGGSIGMAVRKHNMSGATAFYAQGGNGGSGNGGGGGGGTIDFKYCGTESAVGISGTNYYFLGGTSSVNRGALGSLKRETADLCLID